MGENILISNRDTLLFVIPVLVLLFAGIFRLDGFTAPPRKRARRRNLPCAMGPNMEPILRDPDGRLAEPRQSRK